MAVTIHDIAKELNLSAMTVSRVLSRPDNAIVSPATRDRVNEAAVRLGYRPNLNARALATGRTRLIGLWISHLNSSVYTQISDAFRNAIQASGMEISVTEMDWHYETPDNQRRFDWPVDGILAVDPPVSSRIDELTAPVIWQDTPRVNVGSGLNVPWSKDYVWVDLKEGSRTAVEHLRRVGCRRIAYVTPIRLNQPGVSHYDGYIEGLGGTQQPEVIVCEHWDCPAVRRKVREHIEKFGHPDGIYCHHDEIAIATYRALRDLKLDVPREVALIGCEGNEFLEYFDPPLSTVAIPIAEMCRTAWKLLERRLNEPEAEFQGITLPYEFLARESSRS